jgi:hypothetical protein
MAELTSRGDAFVKEMLDDERKSRKSLGEFALSEELALDTALKERIRAQLREIKRRAPAPRFLNITGVARGGMLAHSEYLYRQLSRDAAHRTFTSLGRYVRRFEENGEVVRGLDPNPAVNERELSQTANWACVAMIAACASVNEILGWTLAAAEQLLKIQEEWRALDHG